MLNPIETLPPPTNDVPLILGQKLSIRGCLEYSGDVMLHGDVDGIIIAERLVVSKHGTLCGTVVATEIVIEGRIDDAAIYADRIVLRGGSIVTGEICHRELVLESGCLFEGKSRRHANPKTMVPQAISDTV